MIFDSSSLSEAFPLLTVSCWQQLADIHLSLEDLVEDLYFKVGFEDL